MAVTAIGLYGGAARAYVVPAKPVTPGDLADFSRTGQMRIRASRTGQVRIDRTRTAELKVN